MTEINSVITNPGGQAIHGAIVTISLVTGGRHPGFEAEATITGVARLTTGADGSWSADLTPNADIIPSGTYYQVTEKIGLGQSTTYSISVPSDAGPYSVRDVLVAEPSSPDPLVPVGGEGAVSSVDGRTGTVTLSDRYAALAHTHSGVYSPVGHTHTDLATDAELAAGLALKSDAAHTHDYTGVFSPLGHTHSPATPVTLTFASTIATNASLSDHFRVTLTGPATLGDPTNPTRDGQKVMWELIQDGTGSRVLTLGPAFQLGTDITAVTLTTTAGKRDFLGAVWNASTAKWTVIAFIKGY